MAMITGKVQLSDDSDSKTREVGQPFARKDEKGGWVTLDGKTLTSYVIEAKTLISKINDKKKKAVA